MSFLGHLKLFITEDKIQRSDPDDERSPIDVEEVIPDGEYIIHQECEDGDCQTRLVYEPVDDETDNIEYTVIVYDNEGALQEELVGLNVVETEGKWFAFLGDNSEKGDTSIDAVVTLLSNIGAI